MKSKVFLQKAERRQYRREKEEERKFEKKNYN
jgi:hypothetical protein